MMKRIMLTLLAAATLAGCAPNTTFVYKPSDPSPGGRMLPLKLAVLPFADGTDPVTTRGGITKEDLRFNLARAGISRRITALTPELWAKAFADEAAASGDFRSVRFLYDPSEQADEEYRIEGTVEKAFAAGFQGRPNEFAARFRAIRRSDGRTVWEEGFSRKWVPRKEDIYGGCGDYDSQCVTNADHADFNRAMREIFADARQGFVRALGSASGMPSADAAVPAVASPAPSSSQEQVDGEIDRILNGK